MQICCVCGQDVSFRSRLFVNRVPECNDYETRVDMDRKYPRGEWVCVICDNTDSDSVTDFEAVKFSLKAAEEFVRAGWLRPFSNN